MMEVTFTNIQIPVVAMRGGVQANGSILDASMLYDATPNPVSNRTLIKVFVAESDANNAQLVIRNQFGKEMAKHTLVSGENNINISTATWASGTYYYTLLVANQTHTTKKVVVLK